MYRPEMPVMLHEGGKGPARTSYGMFWNLVPAIAEGSEITMTQSTITHWLYGCKQWLYQDNRPNWIARGVNRAYALCFSSGLLPASMATLEVKGRTSGRMISFPVVVVAVNGERYLVSMLGEQAQWVQNVRAAGGKAAFLRHGREEVHLEEVPMELRAPLLKAYLQRAPGARPHLPVRKDAPVADFEQVAEGFPVFHVGPRTSKEEVRLAFGTMRGEETDVRGL